MASGVTVAAVLAIHIWIHVASGVTVAAVLPIHIWIHALAIGRISNTDMSIGQLNTLQIWAVRWTISSNTMRDGVCQDSSVGIATTVQAGRSGDRIAVGGGNFRARPDRCRSPHSLLYNAYRGFPGVNRSWRGVHCSPLPSAEVKERVLLYLYSSFDSSSPVLR